MAQTMFQLFRIWACFCFHGSVWYFCLRYYQTCQCFTVFKVWESYWQKLASVAILHCTSLLWYCRLKSYISSESPINPRCHLLLKSISSFEEKSMQLVQTGWGSACHFDPLILNHMPEEARDVLLWMHINWSANTFVWILFAADKVQDVLLPTLTEQTS